MSLILALGDFFDRRAGEFGGDTWFERLCYVLSEGCYRLVWRMTDD